MYKYKRQRLENASDYAKAFRPTKWSIRIFSEFLKTFNSRSERKVFIDFSIKTIGTGFKDKNSISFINRIASLKEDKNIRNYLKSTAVKIKHDNIYKFVEIMGVMKKNGIILGSADELAIVLKERFQLKLSISTIRDKLYKADPQNFDCLKS